MDTDDIEAFASKHSSIKTRSKVSKQTTPLPAIKYQIYESKFAPNEEYDSEDDRRDDPSAKAIPSIKVIVGKVESTSLGQV